jgi:GABA permease
LFPYLTVVVIAAIVATLGLMAFDPDQQQAIALPVLLSAVIIVVTGVRAHRRHAKKRALLATP